MCGPMILGIAAIGVGLMGAMQSASAAQSAGQAQAQQTILTAKNEEVVAEYNAGVVEETANYNNQVIENNIEVLEEARVDSLQRGADAAYEERLNTRRSNALGRAIAGSSGTQADTGTNLDLQIQNKINGEMRALNVMNNAEREAYGYTLDIVNEKNRAKGMKYTSDREAEGIRLGSRANTNNAYNAAANYQYAGNLNAQTALVGGVTRAVGQGYDLFSSSLKNPYSNRRK